MASPITVTMAPEPLSPEGEMRLLIAEIQGLLSTVERLPDTGRHGNGCWHRHPDCLAHRIEQILRGESRV